MMMFGRSFAQTSFYFRPTTEIKTYISSTYGILGNSIFKFSDDFAKNPYFDVNNKIMSTRNSIQVGLHVGCNLKNGKHLIEFGWNQDATGSMIETNHLTYDNFNKQIDSYFDNGRLFKSIIFTQRFQLQHYLRLTKSTNKPIRLYFISGIGITYVPTAHNIKKGGFPQVDEYFWYGEGESLTYLDSNITMPRQSHFLSAGSRFSGNISFGFSADIYTKKNKQLFSVSCFYLQGFRVIERTMHQFFIDDNGTEKRYSYDTVSKGSGIYLQLSRRITFYTRKLKPNILNL